MTQEEFKNKYKDLMIRLMNIRKEREPLDQICLPKEVQDENNLELVPWKKLEAWYELFKKEDRISEEIIKLTRQYYPGEINN